jgi:mRNA-degrading endonuclease toxin of MazEF toxin-antitoxin module
MVGRYVPGTVVVAMVSFDEREEAKRRPVVLIGDPGYWRWDKTALVCPVTSARARPGDVSIDWIAAGLRRPSCVRPRPRTIAKANVDWELGVLRDEDLGALIEALRRTLGLDPGDAPC